MDKCLEKTVEYCRQRMIFGKSLLDNQVLHFRLAELKTEVESLRALTYRACDQYINGEDVTFLASMAKLKGGRLIREVSDSCLQYWGGMGFTWNNYVSKIYRDCRLASIGGGADEVCRGGRRARGARHLEDIKRDQQRRASRSVYWDTHALQESSRQMASAALRHAGFVYPSWSQSA